jgi:hypothetical protein
MPLQGFERDVTASWVCHRIMGVVGCRTRYIGIVKSVDHFTPSGKTDKMWTILHIQKFTEMPVN